ncbi:MAG: hypothetical protein NUV86_09740 [Candidatus Scalindua sp.]|nr:hypothetical protein [Candidatus Scalindua sp.]MCR4343943.1 hypothetical protein [Candidatus Scalindua sp.]
MLGKCKSLGSGVSFCKGEVVLQIDKTKLRFDWNKPVDVIWYRSSRRRRLGKSLTLWNKALSIFRKGGLR